eukprot:3448908-Amphidinium_carterae.1
MKGSQDKKGSHCTPIGYGSVTGMVVNWQIQSATRESAAVWATDVSNKTWGNKRQASVFACVHRSLTGQ